MKNSLIHELFKTDGLILQGNLGSGKTLASVVVLHCLIQKIKEESLSFSRNTKKMISNIPLKLDTDIKVVEFELEKNNHFVEYENNIVLLDIFSSFNLRSADSRRSQDFVAHLKNLWNKNTVIATCQDIGYINENFLESISFTCATTRFDSQENDLALYDILHYSDNIAEISEKSYVIGGVEKYFDTYMTSDFVK